MLISVNLFFSFVFSLWLCYSLPIQKCSAIIFFRLFSSLLNFRSVRCCRFTSTTKVLLLKLLKLYSKPIYWLLKPYYIHKCVVATALPYWHVQNTCIVYISRTGAWRAYGLARSAEKMIASRRFYHTISVRSPIICSLLCTNNKLLSYEIVFCL